MCRSDACDYSNIPTQSQSLNRSGAAAELEEQEYLENRVIFYKIAFVLTNQQQIEGDSQRLLWTIVNMLKLLISLSVIGAVYSASPKERALEMLAKMNLTEKLAMM